MNKTGILTKREIWTQTPTMPCEQKDRLGEMFLYFKECLRFSVNYQKLKLRPGTDFS